MRRIVSGVRLPVIAPVSLAALRLLLAAPSRAQDPDRVAEFRAALSDEDFLVPIHAAPDGATAERPGLWAGGPTFSANFHDGFVFHPVLGADHRDRLPLRWRTESVTAGGEELLSAGVKPLTHRTDWRFEYRHPGVTEAYDVSMAGVEQTFVF